MMPLLTFNVQQRSTRRDIRQDFPCLVSALCLDSSNVGLVFDVGSFQRILAALFILVWLCDLHFRLLFSSYKLYHSISYRIQGVCWFQHHENRAS